MICSACNTKIPDGMRFCGMCGAQLAPQVTGRERRRVSVVFVDLAGFSSLTQGFDPERLRDLADEILTVIAGIVEDYDGHVDAFRGDGLIALFGAPHSHPDDPQRAVLAASASLEAIERIGRSKGYPLKGRAGVNTGVVIAGSVGSGRVRDYTVMGSAVNLASRLEAAAKPGEVWVGPETYEATRHTLRYSPTPPLDIRGFADVTQAYRFLGTEQQQSDPFAHVRFVGRQRELERLRELFEAVQSGNARRAWLAGEAGIGKTRLLHEFSAELIQSEPVRVIRLSESAVARDANTSWMQLATQIFELVPGEDRSVRTERVLQTLQEYFPGLSDEYRNAILGSLRLIERRSRPRRESLEGRSRRSGRAHVALAWSEVLLGLLHGSDDADTLVLVVDHRSENPELELLLEQLERSSQPVLIVQTSRTKDMLPADRTITLPPLDAEESLALLNQLASPLLEVATKSLVTQVGGIPSYILELGRALSITPTSSFSGSLASLLQARLDMLSPAARQLLAHAALVGERCWSGLLEELVGDRGSAVVEELASESLLISEADSSLPGAIEYRFQSELLRTAVLRIIPFGDRPALHARIATWLERHAPLSMSALVGHHFEQAGDAEAAYPHYLAAADAHAARGEATPAFRLYEHLLGLNLPADLSAQGSLAFAQAALAFGERDEAVRQLVAADGWILSCDEESARQFRAVHARLTSDLEALVERERDANGNAHAGGDGTRAPRAAAEAAGGEETARPDALHDRP